uniref:Nuclear receptor domain-containing protein n=1 Tax=Panagrolaimus sp. PS1159 TaxID=55785 RepID=A0AC35FN40_9BILA
MKEEILPWNSLMVHPPPGTSTIDYLAALQHQPSSVNSASFKGNQKCAVCDADADGFHYNALSCRSCNAFFRRAVTFKQSAIFSKNLFYNGEHKNLNFWALITYVCRKDGNCDVNQYVRCACRACRFTKCLKAGMRPEAVQPRRDPTGSQKNRKPPKRKRLNTDNISFRLKLVNVIDLS